MYGKKRITPDTGIRLSRAHGVGDMYWINMQVNYDLQIEIDAHHEELDSIERLTA